MKSRITLILLFIFSLGYSQVTNEGTPKTWDIKNAEAVPPIVMPGFDLEKLQNEDKVNDAKNDRPYRFGHPFVVDYNLNNSGEWTTLENGDKVWRIRFYSAGARTMNFLFSDFYMPEGATLYLYNNDRTDLLGAYDAQQNSENRVLGTWLVEGEDVWLEYYEPKKAAGMGKLEIYKVVHGYRSSTDFLKSTQGLNDSGNCHYDVNCTMGGIDDLKNITKRAVGMTVIGGEGFCTGALVNNTSNDGKLYFLTAEHCYDSSADFWAFRFNWISPNPVCTGFTNSTDGTDTHTLSGSTLRARRVESDFCLLELNGSAPPSWNLVWAGWNSGSTVTAPVFGIHHPSGDIMKVSKDNAVPLSTTAAGASVWYVQEWDMGVTEGGSSGSPLFDSNGRIIGQLLGGDSECNGTNNTGGDIYGRFNISWATGTSSASRLRDWLDPQNSGITTLDYFTNGDLGIEDVDVENVIKVYPNPSNGIFTVSLGSTTFATYTVYNMLGQFVKAGEITSENGAINMSDAAKGIYILKLVDSANKSISLKIVKE